MGQSKKETATFGGGCFWCTEAVFSRIKGVSSVQSGYAGGDVSNPTYNQVCTGSTGHAEVIQIKFDPDSISFIELLEVFFKTHDPTTLNRQGADRGTQYRSIILFHSKQQQETAEKIIQALNVEKIWENPIVTEVEAFSVFYPAEDYHQQYFENHSRQMYCQITIVPKLEKLHKLFADKLK